MSHKPHQDAKNIGARFRSARALVPDLNRKSFCERYGINRYTMQSWENGLHVSKGKNVEKFIEALAREGVHCTSEWLIEGIGEPAKPLTASPNRSEPSEKIISPNGSYDQKIPFVISNLIESYQNNGETLISFTIPDDAMAPKFLNGDIVLGQLIEGDEKSIHQKYCIVGLGQDRFLVRKVLYTKEGFMLLALDERVQSFVLSFGSALYPIVWHVLNQ